MKTALSPRARAALAFGAPTLLVLLSISVLFREGGLRRVDPEDARGGALKALAALRADDSLRMMPAPATAPAPAPEAAAPAEASPLPLAPEELAQRSASPAPAPAPAAASAAAPAAPAGAAHDGPVSAHASASLAAGSAAAASAGLAARARAGGGDLSMGGSAGPATYQGGQMGQVQGYSWNQPKLKVSESAYGAKAVAGAGSAPSGVSGSLIAAGGPAASAGAGFGAGGSGGAGFGSSGGGRFMPAGGDGGGAAGGGAGGEGDDLDNSRLPEVPEAQPLPPNPNNAQLEAARKQCDAAAQVYRPLMNQTGDYLSGLRGCDSKKCKRRAQSGCARMNILDCRNKRACPFTVHDSCGDTCSI